MIRPHARMRAVWPTSSISCDCSHPRLRHAVEEFFLTPMPSPKTPSLKPEPALYELRHLRRAISRLEATHATSSPAIADLERHAVNRICELEAQLGSTELIGALTTLRNT